MARTFFAITSVLTLAFSGDAQWLNYKSPGIPRLPDGKPNFSAATPRTPDGKPDLSGLWREDTSGTAAASKAMDSIKPSAWSAKISEKRKENYGSDSPSIQCLPPGPMIDLGVGRMVQTPNLLLMLYGGTLYRQVFLDGRELEKKPNPSWMGYSVGHWDGDTLVVTSNGFNDRTWLDGDGHPHTEALRMTERIRRPDFGHLEVVRTLTDPEAIVEPWTVPLKFEFDADTEQIEYVCNENERDRAHLIGNLSDEKEVPVSPALLSKYAGSYEVKVPETGQILPFAFVVDNGHLMLSGVGPTTKLTALSDTEFSVGGTDIRFATDGSGAVTHAMIRSVEGEFEAIRK